MKIADVRTSWLRVPLRTPIADATHVLDRIDWILVEVVTEEGLAGHAYMLTFDYGPQLLKGIVDWELKRVILGMDALLIEKVWEACWSRVEYIGQTGVAAWGVAAVNIALWDILGKSLNYPVYKLLGAARDSVAIYGSGGWLSYTREQLLEEMTFYLKQGFRAVKIKVGSADKRLDIERVKAVRDAIGDDVLLMVDANQAWAPRQALEAGRRLQDYGIHWLEEPIAKDDLEGYAWLASRLDVPLAAGEREYSLQAFRDLLERRAVAIVQPDALRLGGITRCRKVAYLAETFGVQVASHFYKEIDIHWMASHSNATFLEYFPWLEGLLIHPLEISGGMAKAPERPGLGIEFKPEALREYKVG